ncbi:amidohydrolase 2 [Halovivax asiaticus JCM 14624]|uniref:Amidohydrolase 2 n=1 Tax=Halovivax asiaticus JCM 14624 TaxID=1227490 RepID=M0BVG3_9EURY|nr:amidohydrolase family protein [Halovivax asiaticus]ELZ13654.1 amidohydrolase 2 [Halovivax asiaticus JCM 14624]
MLELEHGFRVVDVNARLTPERESAYRDRGRPVSPDRLEREMHQAGIVRAIVSPTPRPEANYLQANNGVARLSVDRPFVAFARINGHRSIGDDPRSRLTNAISRRQECHVDPEDVEQYAYDDRFHGFTLDPAIDGLPDEAVLATLEDVDLPVVVSGGIDAPPGELAATLLDRSFPIVVGHFGGHPLQRGLMDEMIELLDTYDGCYVDTSLVRYRDQLERALREHPDRVLFGSGTPASHPNVAVMELLTLDVSADKLTRAFSKNAVRVVTALE